MQGTIELCMCEHFFLLHYFTAKYYSYTTLQYM